MKKQTTFLLVLVLIFTFALTACGKDKPTEESTVNLPAIEAGGTKGEAPETAAEEPTEDVAVAYPIDGETAVNTFNPAQGYPIDPSSPSYDADMEAYLNELIRDSSHSLQSLLDKDLTAEQWREVLQNANHTHLQLSEGSMNAIIEWLMSK